MGKILYIRLDSSPLPEAYDEIIVKDFNLESYFCALLGRRLLEDAGQGGDGFLLSRFGRVSACVAHCGRKGEHLSGECEHLFHRHGDGNRGWKIQ